MLLAFLKPLFAFIVRCLVAEQARTGLLPKGYFYLVTTLTPLAAVELLVLRKNGEKTEIFLTQREATDPNWPGQWHFPGTVVRNADSFSAIWQRLAKELGVDAIPGTPQLVDLTFFNMPPRGWSASSVHTLWINETSFPGGRFFDLQQLPDNMLTFHKEYLKQAKFLD